AARESQVPAILDVYAIPYTFSDPLVTAVTLDKSLSKLVVRSAGIPTADFCVVREPGDLYRAPLPMPVFAKPVAEGTGKGISPASKITDPGLLRPVCEELLLRFSDGVILETYLPGREFTTGLVGTGDAARVLGTLEVVLRADAEPGVYSYVNKERCEELVEYRLVRPDEDAEVREAEAIALS
ncbi:MAG: hypothetical protein KJZ78_27775, partial [Bryobacteraceae bacterium]|nr:hypothetical protein [Bryobacteraceae bacterium]